jgi:hypothetical protein
MHIRLPRSKVVNKVRDIQSAIQKLSKEDKVALREWFDQLDAEEWDRQFEEDAKSGKLDDLANRATADFRSGKCREL